jgi:hypothetical protein
MPPSAPAAGVLVPAPPVVSVELVPAPVLSGVVAELPDDIEEPVGSVVDELLPPHAHASAPTSAATENNTRNRFIASTSS